MMDSPQNVSLPFCGRPRRFLAWRWRVWRTRRTIATALDLCCGTGAALRHLRPWSHAQVVGIDMSQGMREVARRMTQEAPGDARIALIRGNVLARPFTAAFEVAVCFGALGHILPQEQAQFIAPHSIGLSGRPLGLGCCEQRVP